MGIELLGEEEKVEIPFKLKQGFILVDVQFANILPLTFIFDTGAENTILFERGLTDLFGIKYSKRIEILGSDLDQKLYALIARNIDLQLKPARRVSRDIIVLEEDFIHLRESSGLNISGILGGEMLRGLVVEIDYKKKKIILYNPEYFEPPSHKKYNEVDITIINSKPYTLTTTLLENNKTAQVKLLIDTGASLAYLLHTNTDSSLVMPQIVIESSLGKGLGGDLLGYIGRVQNLDFGGYRIKNILTSFQDLESVSLDTNFIVRNGIIGNKLLGRFNIIIDYVKEKMYLRPTEDLNKEFAYDKSGLALVAFGPKLRKYYVKKVVINSPAYEAGIRKGDVIKKVGFWPASWYSLESITRKLEGRAGKRICLGIERNDERKKFKFKLRDLFKQTKSQNQL